MSEIFKNRVQVSLASGIDATTTALPLTTGHGAKFGTIGAGDQIRIVFLDASSEVSEVAYITATSGDNATIVRGQDGTIAVAHLAGDLIEVRIGKSTMDAMSQKNNAGTHAIDESHLAISKSAPIGADELSIWDSVTSKLNRLTFTNLAAWIKALTTGATAKTTPVDADIFSFYDSAVSFALKKITYANIKDAIVAAATAAATAAIKPLIQIQSATAVTTTGTSTAYIVTPTPAVTTLNDLRLYVEFHAAAGNRPSLKVYGTAAKMLKYRDSAGANQNVTSTQIPTGWSSDVVYDGADYVVLSVPVVDAPSPASRALGDGQTWRSITGRAFNTFYYNTTGRTLVSVAAMTGGDHFTGQVNGKNVWFSDPLGQAGTSVLFIVPPGGNFKLVRHAYGGVISRWMDLK
jgi:hypothetical protein